MGLSETDGNMADLKERIQAKLDLDADSLRLDDRFKGLYTIRRRNMYVVLSCTAASTI
jgi:hypothetical protein